MATGRPADVARYRYRMSSRRGFRGGGAGAGRYVPTTKVVDKQSWETFAVPHIRPTCGHYSQGSRTSLKGKGTEAMLTVFSKVGKLAPQGRALRDWRRHRLHHTEQAGVSRKTMTGAPCLSALALHCVGKFLAPGLRRTTR